MFSFGSISIFEGQGVQWGQMNTGIRQGKQKDLASTDEHTDSFWYLVLILTQLKGDTTPKTVFSTPI